MIATPATPATPTDQPLQQNNKIKLSGSNNNIAINTIS